MVKNSFIFICLLCISILGNEVNAQNYKGMTPTTHLLEQVEKYKEALAPNEAGYKMVFYLKDKINDDNVHIFRFEPEPSRSITLYGPHVTVIFDEQNKLKGFARMNQTMAGENNMEENQGKLLAMNFLKQYAPDLVNSKYQWSNSHTEKLIDKSGEETIINGSWVKYRANKSGEYLWVILAPNGTVMEFDRDIVWSFFRGGRVNELWLRDEWLEKWLKKNGK